MNGELLRILNNCEYSAFEKAVQISLVVERMVESRMRKERREYQLYLKNIGRRPKKGT